ncbi:MAG TPA: hypothetical protein VEH83_00570, partial [Gemmatimonadales bacterium]|nr:hypothetical protein [Gemmatimonadales bacterium]
AVAADTSWRPQAAQLFLRAGYGAFQGKDFVRAVAVLSEAQPWAAAANAPFMSYLIGYSQFNLGNPPLQALQALKIDPHKQATVDSACVLSKAILDQFGPAQTNLTAGASVSREQVSQLLTYIGNVTTALGPMRTRLKCP